MPSASSWPGIRAPPGSATSGRRRTVAAGRLLRAVVAARLGFLVVGGYRKGKITLLAALLGCVDAGERIVCVEDATDRLCTHQH